MTKPVMQPRSTPARGTGFRARAEALRGRAPAVVTILAALTALAAVPAAAAKHAAPARQTVMTAPRPAGDPIMAIVSIKSQHVTFYDTDGWILRAPVSTGTTGRETPAGVFAVIEKDKDHHSTMYDDAWMPNMLRITWNGIALHGGPLPGYAASHGCVRMPFDFAAKVFDKAPMGMRVIIAPDGSRSPSRFPIRRCFSRNRTRSTRSRRGPRRCPMMPTRRRRRLRRRRSPSCRPSAPRRWRR